LASVGGNKLFSGGYMSGEEVYKQRLRDTFSDSPMPDFRAQRDKSPLMMVEEKFSSTNTQSTKRKKKIKD
jgi:hypothetical protein